MKSPSMGAMWIASVKVFLALLVFHGGALTRRNTRQVQGR